MSLGLPGAILNARVAVRGPPKINRYFLRPTRASIFNESTSLNVGAAIDRRKTQSKASPTKIPLQSSKTLLNPATTIDFKSQFGSFLLIQTAPKI